MSAVSRALSDAWQAQAEWSSRASTLKTRIAGQRSRVLYLVAAAAFFGGLATWLTAAGTAPGTPVRVVSGTAAILAALAATMQRAAGQVKTVEQWNRARSVSEALKEAVYRYRTGTGRYAADRDNALRARVEEIVQRAQDLLAITVPNKSPSREPPPDLDAAAYVERRVKQQIDGYYLKQVATLSASRARWQLAEQGLLYSGAIIGALAASLPAAPLAPWVAVATTIAGAVAAQAEASRFSHLIVSYQATADRLRAIESQFTDDRARGLTIDFEALVNRAEDAISVENQAWMAAWSRNA